jgi:hypothetical protein
MADLTEGFWLYAKDGARYQAHIYHVRLDTSQLDGEPSSMPGLKTARLLDGTHLNYVDENTFTNAVTGELLSRTDPGREGK